MTKTYAVSDRRVWQPVLGAAKRHGIKIGIVGLGTVLAAGGLNQTTFLPQTSLVERVIASAPATGGALAALAKTPASRIAPGGLDAGLEHERIAYWVNRLS